MSTGRWSAVLVAISLASLLAAEERARLAVPVGLAGLGAALVLLRGMRLPESLWRLASAAALLGFVLDALWLSRSGLFAATHLLLYLLVNKTHHLRSAGDHQQLLLVSFLIQLAVSVLAVEMAVLVCLVAYLVAAQAMLRHIAVAREREGGGAARTLPEPTPGLRSAARQAAFACLAAGVLFLVLPRVGAGTFEGPRRSPQSTSGFTASVDLDDIGRIKEDDTLVARVTPRDSRGRELRLLRAAGFRDFDGTRWRRSEERQILPYDRRLGQFLMRHERRPAAELTWFDITLEPLKPAVVPVPLGTERLRGPLGIVSLDAEGALSFPRDYVRRRTLRYQAGARMRRVPEAKLARDPDGPDPPALKAYLGLPELDPRILELAGRLVPEGRSREAAVRAVLEHLRSSPFRYSLRIDEGPDPLARFLVETRAGHCELYAASMAVLLRAGGVPARVVNGFRVSEWSELGGYFLVRQSDTHAWVEVFFPRAGWVPFDPTPPDPERGGWAGRWRSLSHLVDLVEVQWDRYVISWSLEAQMLGLQTLGEWVRGVAFRGREEALAVALLLGALLVARGRRRTRRAAEPEVVDLYRKVCRILGEAGEHIGPSTPPGEVLRRSAAMAAAQGIVALYLRERYAGHAARPEELAQARRALGALRRVARQAAKGHARI